MTPWAVWLEPWENYLAAWSKALSVDIARRHAARGAADITTRRGAMRCHVAMEGDNFALLDFSIPHNAAHTERPTLIVTPYALHDWRIADLAHDHSLIEVLVAQGITTLYLIAWKPARFLTRHNSIDSQFEALRIVLAYLGEPVQGVGLCQGGWLTLAYAARFPKTFNRLALIGVPIEFRSTLGTLQMMDDHLIDASINWLSLAGGGVIRGNSTQSLWRIKFGEGPDRRLALQVDDMAISENHELRRAYEDWDADVLDLPPAYFGDVLKKLYRDNELYEGRFKVLGQCISLASVTCPILIMDGSKDDVVPTQQSLAIINSISTAKQHMTLLHAEGGHLALFLGRKTLLDQWPKIAQWLQSQVSTKTR